MEKKKKAGRFRGDEWFRENVHMRVLDALVLEEPRSTKGRRALIRLPIYKEEYKRQSVLFQEERRIKKEGYIEARIQGEQERLLRADRDAVWSLDHMDDSDEVLLDYVRQCAVEFGKSPRMRDVLGGTYISQRFGSWALVLTLAGLKLPRGVEPPSQQTIKAYQKRIRFERKEMIQNHSVAI